MTRTTFPLLLALLASFGCSSGGDAGAPAPVEPCTFRLAEDPPADVVLVGEGSCAGRLPLYLRIAFGDPAAPTWHDAASAPVRVTGAWSIRDGLAVRDVVVESDADVDLVGLEWSTRDGIPFATDRFFHQGYQSWSYTGLEPIPASIDEALGTARPGGDGEDSIGERPGVSWWAGAAVDARGLGLFAAADGGTVLETFVAADGASPTRLRIVQGLRGSVVPIAKDAPRTLDGLAIALGDLGPSLERWAALVRAKHPDVVPRKPALGGWGSWNLYYANVDAAKLREEATWVAANLAPKGLTDFLLDDGYEPTWGTWSASSAFGAELATLNAEQAALGLKPAVWLAPFYVDLRDPLVTEHPDWFVRKPSGELRTFTNFGPTHAALDVTNDAARAHVIDALKRLRDWGYRTIKIDFLFGGAIAGVRSKPVTGLESYAQWMRAIREAVPELHVIGCGAPILPSVGFVDSMRTGPDVAFDPSPVAQWPFVGAQARHTAYRGFTDAWWVLDPDVVILRGDGIDDAEAWTFVVSSAMSGGNWLSGAGRQSTPKRLSRLLAPEILALVRDGRAARPLDYAESYDDRLIGTPLLGGGSPVVAPHVWQKTSPDGAHGAIAVFAWDVEPFAREVELPPEAREVVVEADVVVTRPARGRVRVDVPLHGTRLFVW